MRTAKGYRKLCRRYDEPGQAHYLTFTCFKNQPFLKGDRARLWLVEAIAKAKIKYPFDLWSWVIMPEHVHLLVFPHEGVQISRILYAIKDPVAKQAAKYVRREKPDFIARMHDIQPNGKQILRFWQRGGGYDRNILSVAELHEKIKYIHCNPVRKELVKGPEDWIWSSYRAWEYNMDEPLRVDRESLPPINRR